MRAPIATPIPTRFSAEELALIDELVAEGVGENRSAVIRQGLHHLTAVPKSVLTPPLGSLVIDRRRRICDALAAMADG
ncbi:MAG: hypothetical protein ACO1PW_13415 [Actinomycetota bacterium]